MNKEIWKDIKGYEGLYQVSNKGNVRSLDRMVNSPNGMRMSKGRILKQYKYGSYSKVSLSKASRVKTYDVHPLVAKAFIPNPNNYPQVNHKNENRYDNRVENLEWCTAKYNVNYGTHNQRMFNNMPKYCVVKYDLNGNYIAEYLSIKIAARENNISDSNIIKCCKGQRKTAGRYIWKYNDK